MGHLEPTWLVDRPNYRPLFFYCTNVSLDFAWTTRNDLIASSSLDRTTRVLIQNLGLAYVFSVTTESCGVMACRF